MQQQLAIWYQSGRMESRRNKSAKSGFYRSTNESPHRKSPLLQTSKLLRSFFFQTSWSMGARQRRNREEVKNYQSWRQHSTVAMTQSFFSSRKNHEKIPLSYSILDDFLRVQSLKRTCHHFNFHCSKIIKNFSNTVVPVFSHFLYFDFIFDFEVSSVAWQLRISVWKRESILK